MRLMNIDCLHDDLERNVTTSTVDLGREIVWFISSLFWLIVVMKNIFFGVFSSIKL